MMEGEQKIEFEKNLLDVSSEFLSMNPWDFEDFCREHGNEELSIIVDWKNPNFAKKVKAFLEANIGGPKRFATIRATKAEQEQALNVFASGVKWEEIK